MKVNFVLIGEGTSDLRLKEHIENILIEEGFEEVSGDAPDLSLFIQPVGVSVKEKLNAIIKHFPNADVIFVHRDADKAGTAARTQEIQLAKEELEVDTHIIPVVPVKMLETWLLADQEAIKLVAGNKNYRGNINCIPGIGTLENLKDSKQTLLNALCEASGATGGKLKAFKERFGNMRARLTYDLDIDGPVNKLKSYAAFRDAIRTFSETRV